MLFIWKQASLKTTTYCSCRWGRVVGWLKTAVTDNHYKLFISGSIRVCAMLPPF